MKRPIVLLYFLVWLVSLVAAYWVGSRPQADASAPTQAPGPTVAATTATASKILSETAFPIETAESALQSLLSGETIALDEALRAIPELSAEAARQMIGAALALPKSDPNRPRLIRELLAQLAKTEPETALELASQIESLRDSERARVDVLEVWGSNDPAAALAWANQSLINEPARTRRAQLSAIYRGYAQNNPEAAFQQALTVTGDNRLRDRLLEEVIETQIETGGLNSAKVAIDRISDPELQNNLRRELIDEWAAFDPEAAAQYVSSLGEDAPTNFKTALISEWAESDPVAAAAWLSQLPEDDPAIARASASIIQEWTRYDLTASAEWLNSLPPSPELDRAVISYTFRAAEEDPETAMTWAESIENDRRRTWMMQRVAATWKDQDTESFKRYLDTSDLTQEQRKVLENAENRGGGGGRWRD